MQCPIGARLFARLQTISSLSERLPQMMNNLLTPPIPMVLRIVAPNISLMANPFLSKEVSQTVSIP